MSPLLIGWCTRGAHHPLPYDGPHIIDVPYRSLQRATLFLAADAALQEYPAALHHEPDARVVEAAVVLNELDRARKNLLVIEIRIGQPALTGPIAAGTPFHAVMLLLLDLVLAQQWTAGDGTACQSLCSRPERIMKIVGAIGRRPGLRHAHCRERADRHRECMRHQRNPDQRPVAITGMFQQIVHSIHWRRR